MNSNHENLLRGVFDAYLHQLDEGELEPTDRYLPYEFDSIDSRHWRLLGREMVRDEIRETTNRLNHWHRSLRRWHAWNNVIRPYDQDQAWDLRLEFLEALAHYCLFMPSSVRDTFTFVATNSLHQVRLAASDEYLDYLVGDLTAPDEKPRHLTRRQKEKRLADLTSIWPEGTEFMDVLRTINDESYRRATSDYRNLNSHSIGPRLAIGMTRAVVRSVRQATTMSRQPDGTYLSTPIPAEMAVSYGFGGTDPLDMEGARLANLDQYRRARRCFEKYRALLHAGLASMPARRPDR